MSSDDIKREPTLHGSVGELSEVSQAALKAETMRNCWQRLRDWLWGYDFFVSYHWASGGVYAVNLAQMLRSNGFDVFLDRADYASGDDWKRMGQIALRNTQRLVLVATREAVTISKPVQHEVEIFTARGRQVVPIIFEDRFTDIDRSDYPTLKRLPDSQLFVDSGADSLATGPTRETVDELIRTHKVLRKRNLRALLTLIPAIIVVLFAAFATYQWADAFVAKKSALASFEDEKKAKEQAVKQRTKAEANSAANWYIRSQTASELEHDPIAGFLFACEASRTAPDNDPDLSRYLNRMVHLSFRCPPEVKNLTLRNGVARASFSENLEYVAIVEDGGGMSFHDLKTGKPLAVPPQIAKAEDSGKSIPPSFAPTGNRILTVTRFYNPERDPDERVDAALLQVWDFQTGTLLTPAVDSVGGGVDLDKLYLNYFKSPFFPQFSADGRTVFNDDGNTFGAFWVEEGKGRWPWTAGTKAFRPSKEGTVLKPRLAVSKNPERNWVMVVRPPGEGSTSASIDVLDARTGKSVFPDDKLIFVNGTVMSAGFSPDARYVVVASKQGGAYSIDRFEVTAVMRPVASGTAKGNVGLSEENVVTVTAVSNDGELAVFALYTPPKESWEPVEHKGFLLAHFGRGELRWLLPRDKYPDQMSQRFVTLNRHGTSFLMQTDDSGNEFAWHSGNSVTRVKLLRHQEMKPDADGERLATIDRDGSVMIWPRALAEEERATLLRAADPWLAAQWSTGSRELFTLNSKGDVEVWRLLALDKPELATKFHVGVRENVENATLTVCHEGTVLLVNADGVGIKVFSVASGQLSYDLREDGGFGYNDGLLEMGLTRSGDRVVSAEYFDDDMFTKIHRVWKKVRKVDSDDTLDQSHLGSEKSNEFRGLLRDASYRIKGVASASIVSFDLSSSMKKETFGSLRFPATGELARHIAERLILSAIEVQVVGETLKLQLPGGAWISLPRHAESETAVRCHPGMTRLVTPRTMEFNEVRHVALSPDGRAIALATEDRLRAFEVESGFPITETIRLGGTVFDIQFQSDSTSLVTADATGTVTVIPVQFGWNGKPKWLNHVTEAILGRTLDDQRKSVRISMDAMAEQRTRFLEELSNSRDSSPVRTLFLEKYGRPILNAR